MAPIQPPPLSLSQVDPGALSGLLLLLGLAGMALWAARRIEPRRRVLALGVAGMLLGQAVLVHNPLAWHAYAKLLGARDVGWRQRDVIWTERARYLRKPPSVRYLAVGSSQTFFLYDTYAQQHDDLAVFAMAGLYPLDFVLYRDYIAAHRPRSVLLYLSAFDLARVHSARRAVMAPRQGLSLPALYLTLRRFPQGRQYDRAILELAVGELFPEFKYGFVWRGLVDKVLGRLSAARLREPDILGEPVLPDGSDQQESTDRASPGRDAQLSRQIESLSNGLDASVLDFSLTFLEEFLDFCSQRGIRVVIVEGQLMPAARTPSVERVNQLALARLQSLAAARPDVEFIPKAAVLEFENSQYIDVAHVTRDAGSDFVARLVRHLDAADALRSGADTVTRR